MNEAAGLVPGGRVGNYTLVQKLRDGGMASLFLAKRTGVHGFTRPVAIKVVHAHLSGQSEFVQMFVDEALLSSHLSHPNIVHVEEFGELTDGRCFLAMEYIDGCSLSEWSRLMRKQDGGGDFRLVTHIGMRVAEALQAAHTALDANGEGLGVVHRDVSPGNILLSRRGHIKVVDFGIAKSTLRNEHTVESLKGKLRYMSPEQARGTELDVRTDVYSLALVMWELLVGRRMFNAKRDLALLDEVRDPKIVPPSEHVDGIPPELDAVLLKALSAAPDDRYATARDFGRALREAVPSASEVEAADIAALVGTIPQRNVDRATMTGTGTGSVSLVSRNTPTKTGPVDVVAPARDGLALGVPVDFPIATAELEPSIPPPPEGARTKRHLLAIAAAALVMLGVLVVALGNEDETPSVASPPEDSAQARTQMEPQTIETAAVDPNPEGPSLDPRRVVPSTDVPTVEPGAMAPVGLPPARRWGTKMRRWTPMMGTPRPRMWGQMAPSVMTPTVSLAMSTAMAEPTRMETRAGTTLLAGEDDEDPLPRRVTMETGTRVQGTLLAD